MGRKKLEYTLTITCPLCGTVADRISSAPFIYLDAEGIDEHSQHTEECKANNRTKYNVKRVPNVFRHLPDDPQPPQEVE